MSSGKTIGLIKAVGGGTMTPIPPEYLPSEEWTFTLEDGSTVTKKVVISE